MFSELKSQVRFGAADEAALVPLAQHAEPQLDAIVAALCERIATHPTARKLLDHPEQGQGVRGTLREWLSALLHGPWQEDDAYRARRARMDRIQVALGMPQRSWVTAMSFLRVELQRLAAGTPAERQALDKLLDIELALLLEVDSRMAPDAPVDCSDELYEEIVERAGTMITTLDARGRVLFVNAQCAQLTGTEPRSSRGVSWVELFVRAADRPLVRELHARALARRTPQQYEGPLQTAHGELVVRWYFTMLPQREALCAIGIDVTHEHERAARTRRAERLASLGTLAGGFAHELRNPLNAAKLQLSLARKRLNKAGSCPSGALRALDLAEQEMQRMAALVKDFLVFARPHNLQLVELDFRELLSDVLSILKPEAEAAGVALQVSASGPSQLKLDPGLMKQALLNLVRNAIEASEPHGHVRLVLQCEGSTARLSVEDDGAGFALDAPIFEPFYTTKEGGTGLGLAIAHRIVMDHAGSLEAKTQPGHTVFVLTLPVSRVRSMSQKRRNAAAALHV